MVFGDVVPAKSAERLRNQLAVSATLSALKAHYRSGVDDLAAAFFAPCLREAKLYRRAAGYFSSMALLTWAEALPRLVYGNELKVRLIASPELSAQDIEVFKEIACDKKRSEYRQTLVKRMLEEIIALIENPADAGVRARILAWLVANDRLEIRFAFAKHLENPGIFHEKMGVFDFSGGARVAFTGSANETLGGHRRNYESIDVYRSWIEGDEERVRIKTAQFNEAWTNEAEGLNVEIPTAETVAKLRAKAPKVLPVQRTLTGSSREDDHSRWRHQDEAVETFVATGAGVLEMATGTGKTRTTLKILNRLIDRCELRGAIIAMDGTDLLEQWRSELDDWAFASNGRWLIYRQYERYNEQGEFALDPREAILLISRIQLSRVIGRISGEHKQHMIVVHDEVHGLGAPSQVATLGGEHAKFRWRLGLSATPERTYDKEGNRFILDEIGTTIYHFPLESAIARGVLSEFDYVPLPYNLTEGDKKRLSAVYAKRSARAQENNPMSNEEVWRELAKVYKTAEMKPEVFSKYMKSNPGLLSNCIIFVETKEYGNRLLDDIHNHTTRYRTYYAEDDRDHLLQFARSEIDCLISCHRLSQGIDIHSLRTVVLFSSARSKLETIQRIGRCLRADPKAPEKRALVVDFVRSASSVTDPNVVPEGQEIPNADEDRRAWLTAISKVRRSEDA